ncbi:hypothetical protein BOTBODRAFT_186422 [Botryobasidium botryosum FD-172 SS1]|uniref:Uncharacterized protein n=1 Tax=Botryobasidium botryosum (strain FD-172 SS1) TaxID=930990 RepID=A0A067MY52_BOTB1|nr:hypothetical protein BOTBODRAFT_186422 [Botryobasidium botryosum FD-172 SS1]
MSGIQDVKLKIERRTRERQGMFGADGAFGDRWAASFSAWGSTQLETIILDCTYVPLSFTAHELSAFLLFWLALSSVVSGEDRNSDILDRICSSLRETVSAEATCIRRWDHTEKAEVAPDEHVFATPPSNRPRASFSKSPTHLSNSGPAITATARTGGSRSKVGKV